MFFSRAWIELWGAAPQLLVGQQREPPLDLVERQRRFGALSCGVTDGVQIDERGISRQGC